MLPTLVSEPPEGEQWQHEIKYDGYRTQIAIEGGRARAFTRNGHDWSRQYQPIIEAARQLDCSSIILDGEMVVQDEHGRSDFGALRAAITHHPHRLLFYAFDLLALNGRDLRPRPLIDRRGCLGEMLGDHDPSGLIQFSAHLVGDGAAMFEAADAMGLEGIVSKKLTSRYRSGRALSWLKIKCFTEGDFTIIGTERGVGPTTALLATETECGLEYVGGAMLTLPDAERERFWTVAERLAIPKPPLRIAKKTGSQWMRPELRARVRYLKGSDKLRHATVVRIL